MFLMSEVPLHPLILIFRSDFCGHFALRFWIRVDLGEDWVLDEPASAKPWHCFQSITDWNQCHSSTHGAVSP